MCVCVCVKGWHHSSCLLNDLFLFVFPHLLWISPTLCVCAPQVQQLYLATGNDRLKLLVLYSGEEDERLRRAAAGTLAMLTAEQPELCARVPATVSASPPGPTGSDH